MTHEMEHNSTYKYQLSVWLYYNHKLHQFVTPFTVYLSEEKAQNPTRKHFEKANITTVRVCRDAFCLPFQAMGRFTSARGVRHQTLEAEIRSSNSMLRLKSKGIGY